MKFFLGIDGGQSSTTAVIGDETGRVVGYGRGGPCNHVKTGDGRAKFTGAILGCVGLACEQAGVPLAETKFAAVCAGFSGGPADKETLLGELVRSERSFVTHDGLIALAGATAGAPGIIAIAGTGQLSFGRNAAGKTGRAGGWGYVFGDEGGGFDLTRQALRAALRQHEGWGPRTALHDRLLAETGATDANDLLHRFYSSDYPRPRIARFSKLVDEVAREGDEVALSLLTSAAQQLAGYAAAVYGQLFVEPEPVAVAPIGGVWRSELLRERFTQLMELTEGQKVISPRYGPAAGALIEAYRLAGAQVSLSEVPNEKE
ncbi:MAG: ATPase [Bryobacteraceae bacterium]|nr:ATPase [Bryobacteraceae bacterium]